MKIKITEGQLEKIKSVRIRKKILTLVDDMVNQMKITIDKTKEYDVHEYYGKNVTVRFPELKEMSWTEFWSFWAGRDAGYLLKELGVTSDREITKAIQQEFLKRLSKLVKNNELEDFAEIVITNE